MAIYGVSFYGSDLYGEAVLSLLSVEPVTAESRAVGSVSLNWAALGGNWSDFRVLRNGYGFAVNEFDGDIILEFSNPSYQSSFTDTGLAPNRFYYYAIYVFDLDTNMWVRAGQAQALTLKDYGALDQMIRNLPNFYLEQDDARIRADIGQDEGPLRRFLRLFALGSNLVRGEIDSLSRVRVADEVSGGLLPFYATDLGLIYEPEIGMRQMRIWLRNAIYLYKIKGTRLGIEGVATAMTGWGANASVVGDDITIDFQANRVNLIPNPSFEVNAVSWTGTDVTLTQEAVDPFSGASSLRLTASGAAGFSIESSDIDASEGLSYVGTAYVKDITTGASAHLEIEWVDAGAVVLSTTVGDSVVLDAAEYLRPSVAALAPVGAVTARLRVVVESSAIGEEVRVDAVLFEEGSEVQDYFDATLLGGDYLWEGTANNSPSHYYFNRAIKNARLDDVMEEYAPLGTTWAFTYAQPPAP